MRDPVITAAVQWVYNITDEVGGIVLLTSILIYHYSDITVPCCLKPPATQLFVEQFAKVGNVSMS